MDSLPLGATGAAQIVAGVWQIQVLLVMELSGNFYFWNIFNLLVGIHGCKICPGELTGHAAEERKKECLDQAHQEPFSAFNRPPMVKDPLHGKGLGLATVQRTLPVSHTTPTTG